MNKLTLVIMIVVICLILIAVINTFKINSGKTMFFKNPKVTLGTSLVFIVRNNQKLLNACLKNVKLSNRHITEIVVMDMGSIDNTLDVAKDFKKDDINLKIYKLDNVNPNNDCFNMVKNCTTNEQILIIDLNKIQSVNPNIYVPDIFKSINVSLVKGSAKNESRINGIRLLDFDFLEREKNSLILKEYVMEAFNNIRMQIEILTRIEDKCTKDLDNKLLQLNEYIDSTISKTSPLLNLIGSTKQYEDNLIDNLVQILKDYSNRTGISIDYKILGKESDLESSLAILLLSIVQDLLNFLLQSNSIDYIKIMSKFSNNKFRLVLKYNCMEYISNLESDRYTLRYLILQSIQNRLNLVNGDLRIKVGNNNEVTLFIQFPTKISFTKELG
jgi:hypothetical protein